jgi:hypothetical protein
MRGFKIQDLTPFSPRPTKAITDLSQHFKKYLPISIVQENILTPITPRSQVVKCTSKLDPQGSGHALNLRQNMRGFKIQDLTPFSLQGSGHALNLRQNMRGFKIQDLTPFSP